MVIQLAAASPAVDKADITILSIGLRQCQTDHTDRADNEGRQTWRPCTAQSRRRLRATSSSRRFENLECRLGDASGLRHRRDAGTMSSSSSRAADRKPRSPMQPRTLALTGIAVGAAATLGGLGSRPAESSWYRSLEKPPYQPPRQVFPIVWPVLYADVAVVSAATLSATKDEHERRTYACALAANLLLNAGWSWVFFRRRRLGAAALTAGALAISSADLTRRSSAVLGPKALPLAAYAAWTTFATVLATHVWAINRT
ncbi:MAG: tryptophan-rich sensory protein [Pseudonocardia sp.]|nr:tryptophan-rich sensory protein [Pseudonocardia sp.]